jgi:hypothetical protein
VLLDYLPREAATVRATRGEAVAWGPAEHLLAAVVDLLAGANWQRGGDKKAPRPKPLPRPGEAEAKAQKATQTRERLLAQRERLQRQRR